jgi:hypothetical protein
MPSAATKSTAARTWTSSSSAHARVEQYNQQRQRNIKPAKDPIFTALAWRAYHIPTWTWCEDYFQYFANNHPVLAICCHHPRHPIRWPMRLLNLFVSVVFGLLVTNLIWLFFALDDNHDAEDALVTIRLGDNANVNATRLDQVNESNEIAITEGMLVLWTVGGGLHALFDNTIWYLSACICCLPFAHSDEALERFQKYGSLFVVCSTICLGAAASFFVVFRASLSDNEDASVQELGTAGLADDQIDPFTDFDDKSSFDFLLSYVVELALALFVYNPLVGTILFSGFLGCGKIPILGGRPYEVAQEQKRIARKQRRAAESEMTDHTSSSNRV